MLGNSLGCHLHGAGTAVRLDPLFDLHNSRLQHLDAVVLIKTLAGQNVERGSHQLDLDLVLRGVVGLGGTEGILDSIDSIVTEAGDLDISTDLGGVGSKLAADVLLQLLLDSLVGESDIVPNVGVSGSIVRKVLTYHQSEKNDNLRDRDLEGIVRMAVFVVQRPPNGLV